MDADVNVVMEKTAVVESSKRLMDLLFPKFIHRLFYFLENGEINAHYNFSDPNMTP